MAKKQPESREQQAFFRIARAWLSEEHGKLLWGSMSGVKLKSTQAAARAKREGLVKGIPDIQLALPRNGFMGMFIEMKRPDIKAINQTKGVLSKSQKEMLELLNQNGYCAKVAYGAAEAFEILQEYMK